MDFYHYREVVYTYCQHTFQFKQLVKVHVALYDPFKESIEQSPKFLWKNVFSCNSNGIITKNCAFYSNTLLPVDWTSVPWEWTPVPIFLLGLLWPMRILHLSKAKPEKGGLRSLTFSCNQCWGKLILKLMHDNIALLPKKGTNCVT